MYSKGATSEASPCLNASVIATCPSAPASPIAPTIHQSPRAIGTHVGHARAPAPNATTTISQTTIAWVESVRARIRTVIADTA